MGTTRHIYGSFRPTDGVDGGLFDHTLYYYKDSDSKKNTEDLDGCNGGRSVLLTELSRGVATPGGHAAAQERGCSGLLAALEKDDTPLVRLGHGAGYEVYRGDDVRRTLYVLTGGVVKLFVSYAGYVGSKDATFLLLGPGDVFGYPVFTAGCPGRVSAEAFTDCEVVKIPGAFLERTVRRRPGVALDVAALLERRLVSLTSPNRGPAGEGAADPCPEVR
jgi:CRP-like cAMP-binding protein